MKEKFLKLTNTVYRLLEYFPEADPLKNRAKDKALSIMENLVSVNETSGWISFQKEKLKFYLIEDIDILLGYLWIAKTQNWINSVNYLIVLNEYEQIKHQLKPVIDLEKHFTQSENKEINIGKQEPVVEEKQELVKEELLSEINEPIISNKEVVKKISNSIPPRQEKIIDFLDKNEKAQVMDLQKILPDVTKRTLRRDLNELMETGRIIRMGDFNQVFYKIKQ